jgi:hypothetical protein
MHQHQTAQMCRTRFWELWQRAKSARFLIPMQPVRPHIENQQDAPLRRKFDATGDPRRFVTLTATAVYQEPAVIECADANPGTATAAKQGCNLACAKIKLIKARHGNSNGYGELRTGTQTYMLGNGLHYRHAYRTAQCDFFLQAAQHTHGAVGLRTFHRKTFRTLGINTRAETVNGKPQTAEAAPRYTIQIHEAKMQARWRFYNYILTGLLRIRRAIHNQIDFYPTNSATIMPPGFSLYIKPVEAAKEFCCDAHGAVCHFRYA